MFDPVEKLKEFIAFPSVSTDSSQKAGMRGAQEFVSGLLRSLGFKVEVVPTALHPVVLAERPGDPSWPHVLIYGHYDVQPADPVGLWKTPPFTGTVVGNRIYGRGAADNKGPLLTNIAAVARLLENNPGLPLRITFLIEGEEEMGSPSFAAFLDEHQGRLARRRLRVPFRHRAAQSRAGGDHLRTAGARAVRPARDRSRAATCIPASTAGCCATRSRRWPRSCATLHLPDGARQRAGLLRRGPRRRSPGSAPN